MVTVDVFEPWSMKFLFTIKCPFEYERLADSLQYNGYTVQVCQGETVIDTYIAK